MLLPAFDICAHFGIRRKDNNFDIGEKEVEASSGKALEITFEFVQERRRELN